MSSSSQGINRDDKVAACKRKEGLCNCPDCCGSSSAAYTPSPGDVIRRAIMMSMALTGERYLTAEGAALYSHDDYDAAHSALGELLADNERLREELRISYPATPVDCLLSELRECFDVSSDGLISRRQFEGRVAEFKKERDA